ncbi:hypothetical protein VOLCADRAFT_99550 [Volvox carteri f. nagariensis]|uniref:protein-tyrosine-phosphatase n=1 Tax=Volvox carteri f. nagariensis TaxID=3068 RepID=D8UI12_VOLCA|nr:uncharacterized protein VOLCADRAFT_99550 [Volvox carteri f. nagariensis]EFJ40657.1 hypothetical protein VOLCADRAFT_99550 [Volvox carteri f. nagariensis]|eukprot:XP_002958283.1 hypothetical protein VOLCADRAFT_99550 [Volvox carteri f. nagariensis]
MASAPFHQSVPVPPPSAHPLSTLDWGAAVHGSSAFLQATNHEHQLTSGDGAGAPAPQPFQADAWHCAPQPVYATSYPGSAGSGAHGHINQHAWGHTQSYIGAPAPDYPPQYPAWQHTGYGQLHPPHEAHANYYQQHYQQNQYLHPSQYAWQSYHCHSAILKYPAAPADGANTSDGGNGDGTWKGWASYSGARPEDSSPSTAEPPFPTTQSAGTALHQHHASKQHHHQQQQQDGQQEQHYLQDHEKGHPRHHYHHPQEEQQPQRQQHQQQKQQKQQEDHPQRGTGGFSPAAAVAASGGNTCAATGSANDLYDPMVDVEAVAEPVAATTAAAVKLTGPAAQEPAAGTSSRQATAANGPIPQPGGREGDVRGLHDGAIAEATLGPAAPAAGVDLIVVWDLDETLIIFNSLLSGAFARAAAAAAGRGPADGTTAAAAAAKVAPAAVSGGGGSSGAVSGDDPASGLAGQAAELDRRLAEMVFDFCDDHLHFKMVSLAHWGYDGNACTRTPALAHHLWLVAEAIPAGIEGLVLSLQTGESFFHLSIDPY